MLIQSAAGKTSFIGTGTSGYILQTDGQTATWISTATLTVARAAESNTEYVFSLSTSELISDRVLTMVAGAPGYTALGASSLLKYNTNNQILTAPRILVSGITSATSTATGALQVVGGVGVGGDLYVGGEIVAQKLTIQYTTITSVSTVIDDITTITNTTNSTSTTTGALVVRGGVGIGKDLHVGGIIYGATDGIVGLANNMAGGTTGTVLFQTAPGLTGFAGPGTIGQLLVSAGTSSGGPVYTNTSSITVGHAAYLLGGGTGSLPYQSAASVTSMIPIGGPDNVLLSNGSIPYWSALSGLSITSAVTATNIANGTLGQVPYQSAPGKTSFYGPGTVGQLLVSAGTGSGGPVYTNTGSIAVGFAKSLLDGIRGSIPYQSSTSTTAMLPIGAAGSVLSSDGNTISWTGFAGTATTSTHLAYGTVGQVPFQTGAGRTSFYGPGTVGQLLVSAGTSSGGPVYTNTSSITVGHAGSLTGGALGSIPYQSSIGNTAMIPIGPNGYVLTSNGTTATWAVTGSGGSSASATTATHLAGGTLGAIPYQTAPGRTAFLSLPILPGSLGQILVSGVNSPVYASTITVATLSVGAGPLGGAVGEIRADNEITAYYSSDKRLKENIKPIENALEKIRTLHGVMFDWNNEVIATRGGEDGYFVRKHDTGIIAQEVEAVLPEVVVNRTDGFKAVRYEKLAGLIIQAINELADQVDELKKKIQ
jgi:hypothetical protein